DRADTGTAAAVRNAERLVQVEMADITAETARPGQSDQCVQVRTVDVDLTAGVVHQRAQFGDLVLVHAVRGRVGDHDAGQPVGVVGDFGAEIIQIDVTVFPAFHDLHAQSGHGRGGGVGAVGAGRDEAGVAAGIAAVEVVAPDGQQARVLALATRIRLQAHRVVTGDLGQPALQIVDHAPQAGCVGGRRIRMQ